jgi:site-specific DNA recombinase
MNHSLPNKTQQQPESAVVYLRVSTEEQVDNYSLDTQEDICKKEAERKGIEILQVFREEGRSAKTITGRPVLIEMLEYCRKHKKEIDAVIVYRLDRISRQTSDYLAIRKKLAECEIKLLSATEPTGNSPTEKFVETMLAGFAQMDNDVRSERSKNGMRARFLSGLSNGYVPLGYLNQNGYSIKDPKTFDIMQEGWQLMGTGTKSLREMVKILEAKGIKGGKRGKEGKLYPQMLNKIFRNKFYAGKVVSPKYGQEVQGQHPPMVTEELFYRVQAVLDGKNTNISSPLARRNRDNPDFPLRRIVKCKTCGASLTGGWCKGKKKHYPYYFCVNHCKGANINANKLDEATIEELKKNSLTDKARELFIAYLREKYYKRVAGLQKKREQADEELKKLYEFRQGLIEKNINRVYSDEMFKEQNKLIEEKIRSLQLAKNDELLKKYNLESIISFIQSKLGNIANTYAESSLEQKRVLLCSIYPSGLQWSKNSYLNTQISPIYTCISDLNKEVVCFGGP